MKHRLSDDTERALAKDRILSLVKLDVVIVELARLDLVVEGSGLFLELVKQVLVLFLNASLSLGLQVSEYVRID